MTCEFTTKVIRTVLGELEDMGEACCDLSHTCVHVFVCVCGGGGAGRLSRA